MVQYIYDAEGRRVAKGTIATFSCDNSSNGFTPTNSYALGLGGEQVTETGGDGQWLHTNVFAGGQLITTYDDNGVHSHIADWLGSMRVQTDSQGAVEETFQNLPFGELVPQNNTAFLGATEHHFTAKERDAESGNDYMFARYYNSATGRFLSPDWSAKVQPVPYAKLDNPQSLNLYAYVQNNPLSRTDPTGHYVDKCAAGDKKCEKGVDGFEKQRQKDLKSKSLAVRNAAAAWGDRNQDNGTSVVFKPQAQVDKDSGLALAPGEHVPGRVTPGATADHKPNIAGEFAEGYGGSDLAQTIAHEGSHIEWDMNFLNSYDPATGKYNAAANFTHFDTEFQAYAVGSDVKPYSFYPSGPIAPNGYQQLTNYINANYPSAPYQEFDPRDYPQ
jgi:RHS repeat-associated protein